jgi:CheY-like chemotaxis protein
MTPDGERKVSILLIEDDDIDAEGVSRAFKKRKICNPMIRVKDGLEGLACLRGEAPWDKLERPNMVLLDLNMPRMNGVEFLNEVRRDPKLKDTIVFVLTTSKSDSDKVAAYEKNVAGYLVKANAGDDFVKLVDLLDYYWRVIEFPPN